MEFIYLDKFNLKIKFYSIIFISECFKYMMGVGNV